MLSINNAETIKEKGGMLMKSREKNITRAAKLLEDAFEVVIHLKATNNKPHVGVVIEGLEKNVKELKEIIRDELKEVYRKESKLWYFLDIFLKVLTDLFFWVLLNI